MTISNEKDFENFLIKDESSSHITLKVKTANLDVSSENKPDEQDEEKKVEIA